MNLKIISTEKTIYDGNVNKISVPGEEGNFTILNNHAPIISNLVQGSILYFEKNNKNKLEISGGIIKVNKNNIIILVEN